tara:strand:+ start:1157 stop:2080 length:924 start_codon:yes stop_codon:yes gene_type:complete
MATQGRTPVPKTQAEIANSFVKPFDTSRGDPNQSQDLNRGSKTSLKDDSSKPFSVGIKDIDESIMYYFQNVIKPFVVQNGQRIEVPVIYGSPERWKSVQRDGYYRDQKGAIMAPLIMFKRNSLTPIKGLYNKLDANHPVNVAYSQTSYNKHNAYDKFNILNNRVPVKEFHTIVVPDYITVSYSCIVYSYYVESLNKIIESINYAAGSYWGNPERFKFKADINSFTTITELNVGQERTVRATFDINLNGYIIPDIPQKDLTIDKKRYSQAQFVVQQETVANLNDLNQTQINKPIDTRNPQNTDTNIFP